MNDRGIFLIAVLIRLLLIIYGEIHDSNENYDVHYTDIDYHVFTDAALHVTKGESPFLRTTYRYTPILSWLLTPNIYLHKSFGKVLFVIGDVVTGFFVKQILLLRHVEQNQIKNALLFWFFNPLTLAISTRGNAESLLSSLVTGLLYLKFQGKAVLCGVVLGLAIHFKIYPVLYSLSLYLSFKSNQSSFEWFKNLLWPNKKQIQLAVVTCATLIIISALCYHLYGSIFVEEAYLHHIKRKDTRHNFSVYFYLLYLSQEWENRWLAVILFLPQFILLLLFSFIFSEDKHLAFGWFVETFIFVTLNKVCTSQYFIWYLSLLSLVLPNLRLSLKQSVLFIVLWFAGQALWLLPAYYLEFQAVSCFGWIWFSSLIFFSVNVYILGQLLESYKMNNFVL